MFLPSIPPKPLLRVVLAAARPHQPSIARTSFHAASVVRQPGLVSFHAASPRSRSDTSSRAASSLSRGSALRLWHYPRPVPLQPSLSWRALAQAGAVANVGAPPPRPWHLLHRAAAGSPSSRVRSASHGTPSAYATCCQCALCMRGGPLALAPRHGRRCCAGLPPPCAAGR